MAGSRMFHSPELDRKYYLLRLRAETFAFELQRERQLQSRGEGCLPEEWFAYLERERQEIMEKVLHYEHFRNEKSAASPHEIPVSSSPVAHASNAIVSRTHSSPFARADSEVHSRLLNSPHSTLSNHSAGRSNSTNGDPSHRKGYADYPVISQAAHKPDPSTSLHMIVFGAEGALSQASQSPVPTASSTPHHVLDKSRDSQHRRRSSGHKELGFPTRAEGHPHSTFGMFNNAQSTTIIGGVFYTMPGNVSYMSTK